MDTIIQYWPLIAACALLILVLAKSCHIVGMTEVGLVEKRFGAELASGNPIAMNGEAGYQAELLAPGFRFKLWPIYSVEKHPWVQIPAGEIGVVIAQVGAPTPNGAKTA